MNDFQKGFRNYMWKAKGFESPPPPVSVDPTLMHPSTEISTDKHGGSGVFFRFNVSPTSFDLDPYFFFKENDYSVTLRAGTVKDANPRKDPVQASSGHYSVQPMAFKGPMYLSGWGYDICGLPVPASGGIDNTRKFNPFTPLNRTLWKSGPIDFRWDDDRKVWTGGPEIIEGKMITTLQAGGIDAPTIGTGVIYRGRDLRYKTYEADTTGSGLILPNPYSSKPSNSISGEYMEYVQIVNRNNKIMLASGDYFSAAKINYEWRILGAGGGGNCIVGKFKKVNCGPTTIDKTAVPPMTIVKSTVQGTDSYSLKFTDIGARRVFYMKTDRELLKDLIPSDSAGGKMVSSLGTLDITEKLNDNRYPYSGYFSLVAFANCQKSSDVYTYKFPNSGEYVSGTGVPVLVNQKSLNKLYDCPKSDDNFGIVTDDQTGSEYYATHPFKFIKHNVRVVACGSNLEVVCNGVKYTSYVISEVDDCANAGTSVSRE